MLDRENAVVFVLKSDESDQYVPRKIDLNRSNAEGCHSREKNEIISTCPCARRLPSARLKSVEQQKQEAENYREPIFSEIQKGSSTRLRTRSRPAIVQSLLIGGSPTSSHWGKHFKEQLNFFKSRNHSQ